MSSNHNSMNNDETSQILVRAISYPLSAVIIFANLFIITGIICNRKLHNTTNYFFLSLLLADIGMGIALPFISSLSLQHEVDFASCLALNICPNFFFLSLLFNLVMVHYERYQCIIYPLHYQQKWVNRCFFLALASVWILPLCFASLPAFGWNDWKEYNKSEVCSYKVVFQNAFVYLEVYGIVIPAILSIIYMTGRIMWVARRQLKIICKFHRAVKRDQPSEEERKMNLRYAKNLVSLTLIFIVFWVPYIVFIHVSLDAMRNGKDDPRKQIIFSSVGVGSMALIPLVLGIGNHQYMAPIRNIFYKLKDRCVKKKDTDIQL
ncbi:G-protein coupled bile acid receptor 1-like [Erpetoichthys calabaricus]|nr:G-protein coupled bile acid receptor 1-like [Erpetoichthys calabaricus]